MASRGRSGTPAPELLLGAKALHADVDMRPACIFGELLTLKTSSFMAGAIRE
jgi:hypothetical protein